MNVPISFAAKICAAGLLLAGLLVAPDAGAQQPTVGASEVRALEAEIDALKRDVDATQTIEERRALVARSRATLDKADALQSALALPTSQIQQRIEQLGQDAAKSPDAAVREQHLELTRELAAHVALTRRAALAEVEASQTLGSLNEAQARALGQELFQRSMSPLNPALWEAGLASLQADVAKARRADDRPGGASRPEPVLLGGLAVWVVLVGLLLRPGRRALDRAGVRLADRLALRDPPFARTLFAVWTVLVGVLLPALCALLAIVLLQSSALSRIVLDAASASIMAVLIGLYVRATALAILQPTKPPWRLWPVGDGAAAQGVRAGNALASAIALIIAAEAIARLFALSAPALLLVHSALALASTVQLAYALYRVDRLRRRDDALATPEHDTRRSRLALWVGIGWLSVAILAVFGVSGYVTLANRMSQWAIWACVVVLSTYVLMAFVDGLSKALATAGSRGSQGATAHLALQQAAVLLSAVARLLLLALAGGALLVPFGAGFTSVLELLGPLAKGFEIGGVTISAAAALRALAAFVVVILLIRFLRSWINHSYLPTTSLQADARDSIDKIVRYAGIVLAILWALTAFGVGMEKVAILASALSVGIGFGLQAITQNFVSGLILLVERPVRIGDWVKVNDVEGDIQRINVRSTEIRVGDHSTMIVPNSELITKVVQNKTMGNSLGRAQVLLSVPLGADLEQAIETITTSLAADEDVLETPAPAVFLDRVEAGMAVLNCFVHVRSPRIAYEVRSRVVLAALRAMRERGIAVTLPPQQFVLSPPAPG